MAGNSDSSHVRDWLPEFKRLAVGMYEEVCSIDEGYKEILGYDETALDRAIEKYGLYRQKLHDITEGPRLDRHKITAALLLAFTDENNQPFIIDEAARAKSPIEEFPDFLMYPNETYFAKLITMILTKFVLASKKSSELGFDKNDYSIRFPDETTCWETGKVEPYQDHLNKLIAKMILLKADFTAKLLLIISHLAFFYELAYDCAVMGFSETYYKINWLENAPREPRYKAYNLAGLFNRRGLELIFDRRTSDKKANMERESVGVIFADCDKFKKINDSFGHPAGDKVLKIYSESILEAIASMAGDVKENSYPASRGGDEFVICLFNCRPDELVQLAKKIKETLTTNNSWAQISAKDGTVLSPGTVSQGLAFEEDCEKTTLAILEKSADKQLYMAKEGKGGKIFFENKEVKN